MGTGAGTELFPSKLTHIYWRENSKSILRKIVKKEKNDRFKYAICNIFDYFFEEFFLAVVAAAKKILTCSEIEYTISISH